MAATKTFPPIVLNFFARGLNTNRQPLFSALTGVGLQVLQFKDYLIDGVNVECTDHFTLARAPGFTKYSTAQLAVGEMVKAFYSTRDLSNNVYVLADTNQNLYKVGASSLTSLLTKGTTAQGYVQRVGGVTYYANGSDLKKWIPNASSMVPWGVAAPLVAPTLTPGQQNDCNSFWTPAYSFSSTHSVLLDANGNIQLNTSVGPSGAVLPTWGTVFESTTPDGSAKWFNLGTLGNWVKSTAYTIDTVILDSNNNIQRVTTPGTSGATAPAWNTSLGGTTTDSGVTWTNVGIGIVIAYAGWNYVFCYRTVSGNLSTASPNVSTGPILMSEAVAPISITAWSITSNVVTFTCATNPSVYLGKIVLSKFGTSTFFNGLALTVNVGSVSGNQFTCNLTHANGSGTENGLASPVVAEVQGASSSNSECNATATITNVVVSGGVCTITAANNFTPGIWVSFSGLSTATFLNGTTQQVVTANANSFTVSLPNQANSSTADSGTATFLAVEVYRTADGGGVYYFDGAVLNGGTWSFYDTNTDAQLNSLLVAPLAHQNDPPPGATGSIVNGAGTIIAWWSNRIWMAVGNSLYFSGGPDTLNGIAEECFPPANVFVFPGNITSLKATTGGLAVFTTEEGWAILGGPQTVSLYPERLLDKFGVLSDNCVKQDGDTVYAYSSAQQLVVLSGAGKLEVGAGNSPVGPVSDLLAGGQSTSIATVTAWDPSASYLAIHRQGNDSALYLSNGVESILRYSLNANNFSPVRQPDMGAGAIASVETAPGTYTLLLGSNSPHDFIYKRDLTSFADSGAAYPSSFVIGNIVCSEPGQPLFPLRFLSGFFYNVGSVPTASFLPNDFHNSTFTALPTVQDELAFLGQTPANLLAKRWPVSMNAGPIPLLLRNVQVKIDFGGTDTVKNELIELVLRPDMEQLV